MAEFKLSFTASEIDEKLGAVETLQQRVTDIENDMSNLEGGGTSGSVSWEDVTDKPFIEERHTTEIFAEQELEFTYNATYGVYVNDSNPSLFIPVENETYTVVWDGEEFIATAFTNAAMPNQVIMGNTKAIGGEDNGLPFYISSLVKGYGMSIFSEDTSSTHRIAVYKIINVIEHIDPKYLPEALQFGEEQVREEILAETTITTDVGIGETNAPLIGLTAGAAYRIVWNGTEYTATAIEATLLGYQAIVVGNTALAGGENSGNYPFLLGDVVGMGYFIAEDKNASSHTVAIYHDTTVIKTLDPKYLPDTASGGSAEIPVFDLAAMGMEVMDINSNSSAMIETDTTEIYAALDKGAVTFSLLVTMNGETVTAICTAHSLKSIEYEQHQCVASLWLGNDLSYIAINVTKSGYIQVAALPMAQMVKDFVDAVNKTATTVDLSAYESNGTIVETYSDGSTITYTMEFDTNGHPTKVTDSKGNVTKLTW